MWGVGCGMWEKASWISERTEERLFRRGFVINNRILFFFVIPAKRAGGPRELERVYSQRLEHSGQLGLSEEDRVALGRTMLLVP